MPNSRLRMIQVPLGIGLGLQQPELVWEATSRLVDAEAAGAGLNNARGIAKQFVSH